MPNANLGPDPMLAQMIGQLQADLRNFMTSPLLLNASTGSGIGNPGLSTDTNGLHLFNASGIEVTTLRSTDGTILVTYPNGTIQIRNDPSGVPGIFFRWTVAGTTQTGGSEIFTSESGLTMAGPTTSTNGTKFSYVNLNDANAEIWVGGAGIARMLNLGSDWSWQIGDTATGHTAAYGNPDGSWVLGKTGGNQVYANATGATQITGGLTVTGTKNFSMPHPLDATKSLVHASTESPVNGVEYWGEIVIGAGGTGTVVLPAYFEALTKPTGRNIQLTPVGGPCQSVPWATAISNGKFTVNGPAGTKLNWLVKAERQQVVNGADILGFEAEPSSQPKAPAPPKV